MDELKEVFRGISDEEIEENKQRFLSIVESFTEHKFDKDKVVNYLCNSDFFVAPASTKYHCNFKGGLCLHSLTVYDTLVKYIKMAYPDTVEKTVDEFGEEHEIVKSTSPYSMETLQLVALFHDISKTNFYERYNKNVKKYSDAGKKYDEMGKFDWVTVNSYRVIDDGTNKSKFVFGTHTETALYMTQSLFPSLKTYEAMAILHHMGSTLDNEGRDVAPKAFKRCPLALLLHQADEYSSFCLEEMVIDE